MGFSLSASLSVFYLLVVGCVIGLVVLMLVLLVVKAICPAW